MKSLAAYYGPWDDVAGQDGMLFSPALIEAGIDVFDVVQTSDPGGGAQSEGAVGPARRHHPGPDP